MSKLLTVLFAFALFSLPVAMPAQAESTNAADVTHGEVCIFDDADLVIWEDPDCNYVLVIGENMLIYTDHGRLPPGAALPRTGVRINDIVPGCNETISPSGRASSQCLFLGQ